MLTRRMTFVVLACAVLACTMVVMQSRATAASDDESALQKRFEQRYRTLLALKDDGRVGETSVGWAEAVESRFLSQPIDPSEAKSQTIQAFLTEENSDRQKLYVLIAGRSAASVQDVARRNARRLFEKASPEHYLKLPEGRWVQKKNLQQRERR